MKKDDPALRLEPGDIPCDKTKQEHDTLEDIYSEGGNKESVEPESVENPEIKRGKNSGSNTYTALID